MFGWVYRNWLIFRVKQLFENHAVVAASLVPPNISIVLCLSEFIKLLMMLNHPPDGVEDEADFVHQVEEDTLP